MPDSVTKVRVFFTMVNHPINGRIRVGHAHSTRENAAGWLPFVRGRWVGCRASISSATLRFVDGVITDKSARLLSEKYNMDPPERLPNAR